LLFSTILKVSEWLSDESGPATCLKMDDSHRPVKLRKVVLGFPCGSNQNEFKFDLSLNYKMANIIQTYSDKKPTLVVSESLQKQMCWFVYFKIKL